MTLLSEFQSWLPVFSGPSVSAPPELGSQAPSHAKLTLPQSPAKPTIIAFLRHCGCPYAEKTFRQLRALAAKYDAIKFIAVSHSDENATRKWLADIGGPAEGKGQEVQVIVDSEREVYAAWGLGTGGILSVLNSATMSGVGKLEKEEGIKLRDTDSGSRWQTAGSFAVDEKGVVKWAFVATSAEQIGDFEEGISKIKNA